MKKKPIISTLVSYYFDIKIKASVSLKRGLLFKSDYLCRKYPGLVMAIGWEGDKHAPILYIDGSLYLRDRNNSFVTFGLNNIDGKVKWYNKEGWLPCIVSEFKRNGADCRIETFADKVIIDGNAFVLVYTRMEIVNKTEKNIKIDKVSPMLTALTDTYSAVPKGESVVMDFVVAADRFGEKYKFPESAVLKASGSFDEHYKHMKQYWEDRIEPLVKIKKLPDERLINAYKAGYVYTMIIKDGTELNVGENGYDRVFDHDVIGIIAALLTLGDFKYFDEYSRHILKNVQYPDARWKYSWIFALYLQKTGDENYIESRFDEIKENTHYIERERTDGGKGIMKSTLAIDSKGYWTIDNWSALFGLSAYKYICDTLNKTEESEWAREQYDSLLSVSNEQIKKTMDTEIIDYLPVSMMMSNENGPRNDVRDANWASMFLFGRWAWDGYLFGAEQHGSMLELIDKTYTYIFHAKGEKDNFDYNFGGYPHGWYSSSYNAGYGSAALRGKEHRAAGIKAYQFMLNNTQSSPFGWWEGINYKEETSPWDIEHAPGGGGSCQHMWGQATATKVLLDSLICEKADGTVIIARGIPDEWLADGSEIEISDYPLSGNKRGGYSLICENGTVSVTLDDELKKRDVSIELPMLLNGIIFVNGGKYHEGTSSITNDKAGENIIIKFR